MDQLFECKLFSTPPFQHDICLQTFHFVSFQITTGYNLEDDRCECVALHDYKESEQVSEIWCRRRREILHGSSNHIQRVQSDQKAKFTLARSNVFRFPFTPRDVLISRRPLQGLVGNIGGEALSSSCRESEDPQGEHWQARWTRNSQTPPFLWNVNYLIRLAKAAGGGVAQAAAWDGDEGVSLSISPCQAVWSLI